MAITYTWKVISLRKTNDASLSNIIVGTNWQCEGTDEEGYSGIFYGATPFDLSSVDQQNFISFEDLTEAIVLEWIKGEVISNYWDHVQAQIEKQINLKKNPIVDVLNLPWNPTPPPINNT